MGNPWQTLHTYDSTMARSHALLPIVPHSHAVALQLGSVECDLHAKEAAVQMRLVSNGWDMNGTQKLVVMISRLITTVMDR